jgi:hypothetical protein
VEQPDHAAEARCKSPPRLTHSSTQPNFNCVVQRADFAGRLIPNSKFQITEWNIKGTLAEVTQKYYPSFYEVSQPLAGAGRVGFLLALAVLAGFASAHGLLQERCDRISLSISLPLVSCVSRHSPTRRSASRSS